MNKAIIYGVIVIVIVGTISGVFMSTSNKQPVIMSLNATNTIDEIKEVFPPNTPPLNTIQLQHDIHTLVNIERENIGLESLSWNQNLSLLAVAHSTDQIQNQLFEHTGSDGKSPAERGVDAGFVLCGEPQSISLLNGLDGLDTAYNIQLDVYNDEVKQYNKLVDEYDSMVQQYNEMLNPFNTHPNAALITNDLYDKIVQKGQQIDSWSDDLNKKADSLNEFSASINSKYDQINNRITQGFVFEGVGENMAMLQGDLTQENIPDRVLESWLTSPGHKENLFLPQWQSQGIGIYVDGDTLIATQNFC